MMRMGRLGYAGCASADAAVHTTRASAILRRHARPGRLAPAVAIESEAISSPAWPDPYRPFGAHQLPSTGGQRATPQEEDRRCKCCTAINPARTLFQSLPPPARESGAR